MKRYFGMKNLRLCVAAAAALAVLQVIAGGAAPGSCWLETPAWAQPDKRSLDALASPGGALVSEAEIAELRQGLVEAFKRKDIDALLAHVHPDVVVTWQNAEVTRGHQEVRDYYERMLVGTDSVVSEVDANPTVDGRKSYGDMIVSYGQMNDVFTLRGGGEPLRFNSRFSALLSRDGERLLLSGLHLSIDAFENPVVARAKAAALWYGALGGLVLLALGFVAGRFFGRSRSAA